MTHGSHVPARRRISEYHIFHHMNKYIFEILKENVLYGSTKRYQLFYKVFLPNVNQEHILMKPSMHFYQHSKTSIYVFRRYL